MSTVDLQDVRVRAERPEDRDQIHALTQRAFAGVEHSEGSEPAIVRRLRQDGDLRLSLVAVLTDGRGQERVIGHVAFSPVVIQSSTTTTDGWLGLGPVSVAPEHQGQAVGQLLIRAALQQLQAEGVPGIVLLGDPEYYSRFGFVSGGMTYLDAPPEYVQHRVLDTEAVAGAPAPRGEVRYAPAFAASS